MNDSFRTVFGGKAVRDEPLKTIPEKSAMADAEPAESPSYLDSAAEYNFFYGSLVASARWFKSLLFVTNIAHFCLEALLIILVIIVNSTGGNHVFAVTTNAKGVVTAPAVEMAVAPSTATDAEVESRLVQVTKATFSVTVDPVQTRTNVATVNLFVTGAAAQFVNDYWKAKDPFIRGQSSTVEVLVTKVGSISAQTYEVSWQEIERDFKGNERSRINQSASFNVATSVSTDRAVLINNPQGVKITRMSFLTGLSR